jgi:hypothetical protein
MRKHAVYNFSVVQRELTHEIQTYSEETSAKFNFGTLWTVESLSNFMAHILCYEDQKVKNIYRNIYLKNYVGRLLESTLNTKNKTILKIYWFEFTKIRYPFFPVIRNVQQKHIYNLSNTVLSLQKFMVEYDSDVVDIEQTVKRYVKTNHVDCLQCKICLDNRISHGLIHATHICTICMTCAQRCMGISSVCPFCRLPIQDTIKIII